MKILLFNHSGSLNRGCEAIVRTTVNIVDRACGGCEYLLYSYNPDSDASLLDLKNVEVRRFAKHSLGTVQRAAASLKYRLSGDESYSIEKQYSDFLSAAYGCDLCLSIGGDTYCYGDNSVIRALTDAIMRRKIKTVLWGASIGAGDLTTEKEENLKRLDGIFVRESLSRDALSGIIDSSRLRCFADPAFTLEAEELPLPPEFIPGKTVGVNASPLVAKINPKITQAVQELCEHIVCTTDMNVMLTPHVTENGNNDFEYLNSISQRIARPDRVFVLPDNLTASQYKGYISRARLFVGARTHATIAAYSTCVPTMVLGYSIKSKGIARDLFGSEKFVFDVKNIANSQPMIAEFERLLGQENDIRAALGNIIPPTVEKSFAAGRELLSI